MKSKISHPQKNNVYGIESFFTLYVPIKNGVKQLLIFSYFSNVFLSCTLSSIFCERKKEGKRCCAK